MVQIGDGMMLIVITGLSQKFVFVRKIKERRIEYYAIQCDTSCAMSTYVTSSTLWPQRQGI